MCAAPLALCCNSAAAQPWVAPCSAHTQQAAREQPQRRSPKTLPVGLINSLAQRDFFNWGPLMAGATLASIPVAILYFFFMDKFVGGLTAGAVKG